MDLGTFVSKKNKNNRDDNNPNSLLLMDKNVKTKDSKKKDSNFKSTRLTNLPET